MSRTYKDRKGYKTRRKRHGYPVPEICNYTRGGYEDYDHSDQELYVDDQCCENCRYRYNCDHTPFPSGWCEYWKGGGNSGGASLPLYGGDVW